MGNIDFDTEARAICSERDAWWSDLRELNAGQRATGADFDALMQRSNALDARVEALRKRFYPRAHRLVISDGAATMVSRTARSTRRVWSDSRN